MDLANQIITEEKTKRTKKVNLSYYDLNQIPERLSELDWITSLTIIGNKISDISPLRFLTNLTTLDLSENSIVDLSPLNNLKKLTSLNLNENQISELEPIGKLNNLKILQLNSNRIKSISVISKLKKLEKLYINSNSISNLEPLSNHESLSSIQLNRNEISDFSPIGTINKLESILFKRNEHSITPHPEIIKQGSQAIINFAKAQHTQSTLVINEAKILIVGESRAGKTSLVKRLINENAEMPNGESTKGVELSQYEFQASNNTNFTLNIWDFAGQVIYHQIHQFFLSKNSLYIILEDTGTNNNSVLSGDALKYWLQIIDSLAKGSATIIIQNEKNDLSKEIDYQRIKESFNNIQGIFQTNILTKRGLPEIKEKVKLLAQKLPLIGEKIPKQWVEIREKLKDLAQKKDYITYDRFIEICEEHNIIEDDKCLQVSTFFHNIGSFLHFHKDDDLRELFILNSNWITDAVYKILDNEKVINQRGFFSESDLKEIWKGSKHQRKWKHLIGLMEKFKLCFKVKKEDIKRNEWLVPQLLPKKRPFFHWDERENLRVYFTYGQYLPKGILTRFMVNLNRYIKVPKIDNVWRYGIFLYRENTTALITEIYEKNKILIQIRGNQKIEFMSIICDEIDSINQFYGENLKVYKEIPCNCKMCITKEVPHFFNKDIIELFLANEHSTIFCDKSGLKMRINDLKRGVHTKEIISSKDDQLKEIGIFLASSIVLQEERDGIKEIIFRKNKLLFNKGIFLNLHSSDDSLDSMNKVRKQNDYNNLVLRSDIFIGIFSDKAGKYTQEEFEIAFNNLLNKEKPKYIYIYIRNLNDDNIEIKNSLTTFKEFLEKKLKHHTSPYESIHDLQYKVSHQIDLVLDNLKLK